METVVQEVQNFSGEAYAVILAVFGFAGTFITQVLKKVAGQSGAKALVLTAIVSAVLSVVAMAVSGDFSGQSFFQGLTAVFSLSTVVYRLLVSEDKLINSGV